MDLNEQADRAVDRMFDQAEMVRPHAHSQERITARRIWLDGYEAGVKATQAKAEEAFGEWAATQIGAQS